jgi:hypothetical protein
MQREITARMPPPAAVGKAVPAGRMATALQPPAPQLLASRPDQAGPGRNGNGADLTVAALEKWLDAINVTRANRSS